MGFEVENSSHLTSIVGPRNTCAPRSITVAGRRTSRGRAGDLFSWHGGAPASPSAALAPTPSSWGWACWEFRAWRGWEWVGIREIQAADSWPSGCNPAQVTPDASPSFGCCDGHAADRWPQRAGRSGSCLTARHSRDLLVAFDGHRCVNRPMTR